MSIGIRRKAALINETKLRNMLIRELWIGLCQGGALKYAERVKFISERYCIGFRSVERIIYRLEQKAKREETDEKD